MLTKGTNRKASLMSVNPAVTVTYDLASSDVAGHIMRSPMHGGFAGVG
jgi:hypothetical protein